VYQPPTARLRLVRYRLGMCSGRGSFVAVAPPLQARIRAILRGWELRFAETGAELTSALDEAPCDMVIVGLHFDESSAVAAVQQIFARAANIPVVCVRGLPFNQVPERTLHGLRLALHELGAQNFIDLLEYPNDVVGNTRLAVMLERLVLCR
jgi:hypothetical protein